MDHDHVFRDRFGEILPAVFTPDYAAHPDYDDANAATLTVQKTSKNVSCDACASKWSGEALDYDIERP